MKIKAAYTLSEVLLAIAIIGIIAAITIPTLIMNTNSKKHMVQFTKDLSTLNQAVISSMAQFDMNFMHLIKESDSSTCAGDNLMGNNYSMCGLLNNTLSVHNYLGKYGEVINPKLEAPYSITTTTLNIENFLIFILSDGSFVGFNPLAKNCGIGANQVITTEMITSGILANCLGFVDVNGFGMPNSEVVCVDETTELSISSNICKILNSDMGDVFPIVFHDGVVQPATNASYSAFIGVNGKK